MSLRGLLLVLALALCGWAPLRGDTGEVLSWPAEAWPLTLADGGPAWALAAAEWSRVGPAAFTPVRAHEPGVDGVISVTEIPWPEVWLEMVGDPSLIAFTVITHEGGQLIDADVLINTERFDLSDPPNARRYVRQTVLAHELGHALGLGHTCGEVGVPNCGALSADDPGLSALMYPRLVPGDLRGPNRDDAAGLVAQSTCALPRRIPLIGEGQTAEAGTWTHIEGVMPGDSVRVFFDAHRFRPAVEVVEGVVKLDGFAAGDLAVWTATGQGGYWPQAVTANTHPNDNGPDSGMTTTRDEPSGLSEGDAGCAIGLTPTSTAPTSGLLLAMSSCFALRRRR